MQYDNGIVEPPVNRDAGLGGPCQIYNNLCGSRAQNVKERHDQGEKEESPRPGFGLCLGLLFPVRTKLPERSGEF